MSNKIVSKRQLTDSIYLMEIEAPRVAKYALPVKYLIIINFYNNIICVFI
ncbi:hypothetical protein [Clostridioides difficile]|nr:hypothetical protein [Clostridioides difficile]